MEHHCRAANHHNQLHLRCDIHLGVVLGVQLLKHRIVIILVLHDALGPAIQLEVERVETFVQKLETGDTGNQDPTLEPNRPVNLDRVRQALVLGPDLLDIAIGCQARRCVQTLFGQPGNLVQEVRLFILDRLVALTRTALTTPTTTLLLRLLFHLLLTTVPHLRLGWQGNARLGRVHESLHPRLGTSKCLSRGWPARLGKRDRLTNRNRLFVRRLD